MKTDGHLVEIDQPLAGRLRLSIRYSGWQDEYEDYASVHQLAANGIGNVFDT